MVRRLKTKLKSARGLLVSSPGVGPSPMATLIVTGSFSRAAPFSSCVNPRIPIALSFSCLVGLSLARHDSWLLQVTQNNASWSSRVAEVDRREFLLRGDSTGDLGAAHWSTCVDLGSICGITATV